MDLKEIKTVAVLLRISDNKKDSSGKRISDEETLKNHKRETTDFAKKQGWKIRYYEEVLSGGSAYDDRKELQQMIADIELYDAILVMEISRLSRQGDISQRIKQAVIDYRKLIITLNPFQVYDIAAKPMDGMIFDVNSSMNEYERRIIGLRIKQNKLSMAKDGLNASGSVPLGYIRNPKTKTLEIQQEEAKAVRHAFKLCLDGLGYRTIADELNKAGFVTKNGNAFRRISIKDMLNTATYKGFVVYNNYQKTGRKKEIIETIEIPEAHEPIIKPEVWDKVQQQIINRAERYGILKNNRESGTKEPCILKDLLFCSECGRKQRISFEKNRGHLIRKCSDEKPDGTKCKNNGFVAANLEKQVMKEVFAYQQQLEEKVNMLKSNDFTNYNQELETMKNDLEKQLKRLNVEFKTIRKMAMNYEMEKEENGFTDEDEEQAIAEDKKQNREARMKVQESLEKVKERMEKNGSPENEIEKLQDKIKLIEEIKSNPSAMRVNNFLKRFIHKIHYKRILPPEIMALGTKNEKRKNYPATIEINFVE
jgi:site-specific DNA recombinase